MRLRSQVKCLFFVKFFNTHGDVFGSGSVFGRRLHKLEKLVSDPYLLYLANKNMFEAKLAFFTLVYNVTDKACILKLSSKSDLSSTLTIFYS